MQTVIFCGGEGTRISGSGPEKKELYQIGDRPILWHIMKIYDHFGHHDFILCLGYKGELIRRFFFEYELNKGDVMLELSGRRTRQLREPTTMEDWRIILADTGQTTQTGGRLARIRDYVEGDYFLMTYGDGLGDVNLDAVLEHHRRMGRIVTLTAVQAPSRFGDLGLSRGLVRTFREKARTGQDWINGGFLVCDTRVFDYITGDECVFETDVLERLVKEGQVAAYPHMGSWQCMDTYRALEMLNELDRNGEAFWKVWETTEISGGIGRRSSPVARAS